MIAWRSSAKEAWKHLSYTWRLSAYKQAANYYFAKNRNWQYLLKKELQKVFIEKYQSDTQHQLTPFQADIMSMLYIQTLQLFLNDEQELNIEEANDLLKMIKEFII